jgi:hypothetical protein
LVTHRVNKDDLYSISFLRDVVEEHNYSGSNQPLFYGGGGRRPSNYLKQPPQNFPHRIVCGECNGICGIMPKTGYVDAIFCPVCGIFYFNKENWVVYEYYPS